MAAFAFGRFAMRASILFCIALIAAVFLAAVVFAGAAVDGVFVDVRVVGTTVDVAGAVLLPPPPPPVLVPPVVAAATEELLDAALVMVQRTLFPESVQPLLLQYIVSARLTLSFTSRLEISADVGLVGLMYHLLPDVVDRSSRLLSAVPCNVRRLVTEKTDPEWKYTVPAVVLDKLLNVVEPLSV